MTVLKIIKQIKGITLIELIVTIALISIVTLSVVNLFLFNNKVFNRSDALSQVQFDVRMASDRLTKDLRNINKVSLTDDTLAKKVELIELQSSYPSVRSVSFTIKSEGPKFLVEYTILGHDSNGNNQYSLGTEVLLNNITSATLGTKSVIYYE